MAKIRVYEFARTLNIQNKILLEKLRDMGVSVKSHMSSLDEEVVARVKAELFGAKPQEVEVTRVKSTVIRRRKKPVEVKTDVEAEPLKEVTPLEKKVKEKPVEKKVAKKKKDLPKIIEEPKQVVEPVELEKKKAVAAKLKPVKALKPKKALKKEIPAKIIKKPAAPKKRVEIEPKPEPELKPEKPPVETTEAPVKKHKKKVITKKPAEDIADKKFFKKKISFRKKEIVVGKDLYTRGYPGRKGR